MMRRGSLGRTVRAGLGVSEQIFLAVRFVRNAVQVHPGQDQQSVFHAVCFHLELS